MSESNETLILSNLARNEQYARKVSPFLKDEYFSDNIERTLFIHIQKYFDKYNQLPKRTDLIVNIKNDPKLSEHQTEQAIELTNQLFGFEQSNNIDWLVSTTEAFCQDKAVFNAIQKAIAIYQGEEKQLTPHAIPELLKKAIGVCFESRVGIDFFDDAESRFDYYTQPDYKTPFHIEVLNEITCGGVPSKTLNVLVAGVNVGKSLGLIDFACGYMRSGKNVLFISLEMREEMIMQRIDANMLKIPINDVVNLGKEKFLNRIETLKQKSYGKLKVKEFPPGSASAVHIRHVVDELLTKQNFKPDIIMVDYLQIAASSRLKHGTVNSFHYFKSVAEELRALAVELDVIVWTAAQFNRTGMNSSDADMSEIAESKGIADTVDFALGIFRTEELDNQGQLLCRQLKSRYANKSVKTRFTMGVDVNCNRFYDVAETEQEEVIKPEEVKIMSGKELKNRFMGLQ